MHVEVIGYDHRYAGEFNRLNLEWINAHFRVEPNDLAQMEDPRGKILAPGGEIFFVLEDGAVAGTCAMIPSGLRCFELAKMAVDPAFRGRGHGDRLILAAVDWARGRGAERVVLLSNTILAPAVGLYKKHGFTVKHLGPHPHYERCDIEMELKF